MQKSRNIKLIIILAVLIMVTGATYFLMRPEDKIDVDRNIFSLEDPSQIDRVEFEGSQKVTLKYNGTIWKVNDQYEADRQRISVLFALLKQEQVRRKVSKLQEDSVANMLEENGTNVLFYKGNEVVKSFYVWGDDLSKISYMANDPKGEAYIVEIPGYRNFLAAIYQLDVNGWRNPLVFDFNWSNLKGVDLAYNNDQTNDFSVVYDGHYYHIPEIQDTDSLRMTDFLDDLSLLYVNDYLNSQEVLMHKKNIQVGPQATVKVEDVGNNVYTLEIYSTLEEGKEILGRIDSTDFATFDISRIRRILRPRNFFKENKGSI